jgi:hypothetical protein
MQKEAQKVQKQIQKRETGTAAEPFDWSVSRIGKSSITRDWIKRIDEKRSETEKA